MWWHYILVFLGALLFDIVPFPFPPAFTIMMFFQIIFDLNVWWVILIGVAGSVVGRYILLLYAPLIAEKYLKSSKNKDIQLLGDKLNENKVKGQLLILAYSLLPLPTTPLFLGAGISKIKPKYIIPSFIIGKLISDTLALQLGSYASKNMQNVVDRSLSWQSLGSLLLGFILLFCLFFINWHILFQEKRLVFNFKIWK